MSMVKCLKQGLAKQPFLYFFNISIKGHSFEITLSGNRKPSADSGREIFT